MDSSIVTSLIYLVTLSLSLEDDDVYCRLVCPIRLSSLRDAGHINFTMTPSKLAALIYTMFLWSHSARIDISLYRQSRL